MPPPHDSRARPGTMNTEPKGGRRTSNERRPSDAGTPAKPVARRLTGSHVLSPPTDSGTITRARTSSPIRIGEERHASAVDQARDRSQRRARHLEVGVDPQLVQRGGEVRRRHDSPTGARERPDAVAHACEIPIIVCERGRALRAGPHHRRTRIQQRLYPPQRRQTHAPAGASEVQQAIPGPGRSQSLGADREHRQSIHPDIVEIETGRHRPIEVRIEQARDGRLLADEDRDVDGGFAAREHG